MAQEAVLVEAAPKLSAVLAQIAQGVTADLVEKARLLAQTLPEGSDAAFWTAAMLASHTPALAPSGQLQAIADMARGFAMGTAAHGIGAARALQVNADAGAWAALALGLQVVTASLLIPLAARWW